MSPSGFYGQVYNTAKELGANDVQARLAAAQASLESGYGQNLVGNNYFGVKASQNYAGPTVSAATNEEVDGQTVGITGKFRAYDSLADSVAGYMSMMAKNFPDAWGADNISDAISGLDTGVYGKYATLGNYKNLVASIDNNLGKYSYAANVENAPVPYSPDDPAANSLQAQAIDGLSGVVNPAVPETIDRTQLAAPTGILGPSLNNFGDLAAAGPVSAPMDVNASGVLGSVPGMDAAANVGGVLAGPVNAYADNIAGIQAPASAKVSMPSFDMSRFGDVQPSTDNFDTARFGEPAFDPSRFGPTPSEMAMATPASVLGSQPAMNSFADMAAAGPVNAVQPTGINSPEHQQIAAQAEKNLADMQSGEFAVGQISAPFTAQPSQIAATGMFNSPVVSQTPSFGPALSANIPSLASVQPVSNPFASSPVNTSPVDQQIASAPTNTGLVSGYTETDAVAPGINAINSVAPVSASISQNAINGYNQMANTGIAGGITNLSGNTLVGPTGVATSNVPSMPSFNMVTEQAPGLNNAPIDGPVSTPAVTQQQQQQAKTVSGAFPSAPKQGILSGINKGMLTGGILGGVVAGPVGGILGGLLGNQVAKNGGFTSPFGASPMSISQVPGTMANIGGIYGGAFAPGTQAPTNNGGMVTSLGGGWTAITGPSGVTTSVSPWGGGAGYFGPSLTGSQPSNTGTDNGMGAGGVDTSGMSPGLY